MNENLIDNTRPEITVVIPAFNQEKYIGRCIRSVLSQQFPREKYEVILVNDGSTDNTGYGIDVFKDELIIINNEKNVGLPASLNMALSKIKTPYFVRVDADDYISSYFLPFLYGFIEDNEHMDAVSCDYNLVDNQGGVISRKNCMDNPIGCGIIFRTDQIIDIGSYDEDFLLHEEQDLRIRFLKKYKIHRLEMALYRYRMHDDNMTNNKSKVDHFMKNLKSKHQEE
jgi:glycosyltransferase involved in cell wall biosynthesis